ncbi:peroxisomal membrane protein pex14 [Pseudocyphellaria aurata]|nr:peroxisomal membrane protein pex14 [Pseudocyphellaria aurata]
MRGPRLVNSPLITTTALVRLNSFPSTVSFLQHPNVASSTLSQRVSFLRSKNLTQEEIDLAVARAGDGTSIPSAPPPVAQPNHERSYSQVMRQPAGYGYGPYQGPWSQPFEPPRRDWRDWFIMATVTSGVSYSLYLIAKRYILPLISPPTPPQLEADKASIDESFSRAFVLIDQLAADTAGLKASEAERTEKLDSTLQDVELVVSDLKAANTRREAESRILADQVRSLKDLIPKALEGWKASGDGKLEDLGAELRSLKKLVGNRVGNVSTSQQPLTGRPYTGFAANREKPGSSAGAGAGGLSAAGRTESGDAQDDVAGSAPAPAPGVTSPKRETPSSGRAAIPAWQMSAASMTAASERSFTKSPSVEADSSNNDIGA